MHQGAISVRGGARITVLQWQGEDACLYVACVWNTTCAVFTLLLHGRQPVAVSDFGILQLCTVRSISRCHAALRPGSHFSQALDKGAPVSPEK